MHVSEEGKHVDERGSLLEDFYLAFCSTSADKRQYLLSVVSAYSDMEYSPSYLQLTDDEGSSWKEVILDCQRKSASLLRQAYSERVQTLVTTTRFHDNSLYIYYAIDNYTMFQEVFVG